MDYLSLLLLFGVGVIAGAINVMAGGGSSLTVPTLIFMGLDGALANGTNRIAIFAQNIFAVGSFRQQNLHQFRESLKMAWWTLPGGILGAFLAVRVDDALFRQILAIVLIGVVLSMVFTPVKQQGNSPEGKKQKAWLLYPMMLGVGFYGGFIQVGVGFLFMAILFHLLQKPLLLVNMHKVFIVLIYSLPALLVFAWNDCVDWKLGICLAAGNATGGWWAARFSVKGGERVIRWVLWMAMLIMAMKLLKLF